jgi:hypothetical protein
MFGICKSKTVLETAVAECVDDTKGTLGVFPRVVNVKSPGKNRIPVRIFNMTTKVVYLKPKSTICGLNEVKVMRHTDLGKAEKFPLYHQHSVTVVSRTVFDLQIPDTVKTDIEPNLIGLFVC